MPPSSFTSSSLRALFRFSNPLSESTGCVNKTDMPFSILDFAWLSWKSKFNALIFNAPDTINGFSQNISSLKDWICLARTAELYPKTVFTWFLSSVGTGSPVTARTLFTPSIFSPSSSAFVALIFLSRHVIWGIAVSPSSLETLQARMLLSILAFATGQSAISMASTPASWYRAAPSIKKSMSGSTGGSNSTTRTFFPCCSFSAKEFPGFAITSAIFFSSAIWLPGTSLFPCTGSFPFLGFPASCPLLFAHPSAQAWIFSCTCAISSGVVPQHPPTIETPSCKRSYAACPKYPLFVP